MRWWSWWFWKQQYTTRPRWRWE